LLRNLFHASDEWRTARRVIIAALAAAALVAVYGATGRWGAAPAWIGAALLLAACVLAEAELIRRLRRRLDDLSSALDGRLAHRLDDLSSDLDGRLTRRLDDLSSDLDGRLTTLANASVAAQKLLKDDIGALRGEEYISFSRRLGREDEAELCSTWSERLGVTIEPPYVRYLERKLLQIEGVSAGRLAAHMRDALLRAVVARSVEGPEFSGLEIGVLFGISAMVIQEAVGPFFECTHMMLIDPFEGYYRPDELDPMTKLPGVPPEQYTVIQGYSTDDAVVERVSSRTYNFLLIDGDHSFEGVKADFDRYAPMLQAGGYLVLDDYRAKEWPGVTRFVDEVLSASSRFECVGMSWRTAVYRRT
jgi:predicted O-methyltransferase YrrM